MSGYRKKLSGAEYRKRKAEESTKIDSLLKKIPKISNFITSSTNSSNNDQQLSCSSVPELEETSAQDNEEVLSNTSLSQDTNRTPSKRNFSSSHTEELQSTTDILRFNSDPVLWNLNEEIRDFITERYCSKSLFQRTLKNGEIQRREWLIYSETKGSVFCVPCLLFGRSVETNAFTGEGFRDWKNSKARLEGHENSDFHKTNISYFKALAVIHGRVDQRLIKHLDEEITYWKKILYRVIAIITSLAIRGLLFRRNSERIGDPHNGNFLGTVELLAEFDPFLSEHLKLYAHPGSGNTSYLSKIIYEEIILLMQNKVLQQISSEVYVHDNGEIVERFLEFISNIGHKTKDIENDLLQSLENNGLDIMNCRGQSYDNASNMSGIYSSLQTRIKTINPVADYVPCAAHSLNLVGSCAVESVTEAVDFFSTLQELYNFFTISIHRWELLVQRTNLRVKSFPKLVGLLDMMPATHEKPTTRSEATRLQRKLQHLETTILVIVWNVILDRFNAASKKLQESQAGLSSVVQIYSSLALFLQDMRERQFSEYEEKAKPLSVVQDYYRYDTRRKKTRKIQPDESRINERIPSSGQENFRTNVYYPILDTLSVQLAGRKSAYEKLYEKCNFFDNLSEIDTTELKNLANKLIDKYPDDLEETLGNECIHLHYQLKDSSANTEDVRSAQNICNVLHSRSLRDVYPNVNIALRIFLRIPVTNCSGERSFSTLKRVKTYLRASMDQDRLNALALLSIEAQLVQEIEYDDIIDIFARTKARKKNV
ncbi:zinc finger MYM-type protein 1-like [Cotesia typhae]|uniref:zinc finger MYM-type protein 1-like n=1 Tax=Cotesia typhae TaxID=2053667 RepID=UPI003D6998BC